MFVVGHQDKGMKIPPIGLHRAAQPVKAFRTVSIVSHDRALLIAARDDMVQWCSAPGYSMRKGLAMTSKLIEVSAKCNI